jgi:hypothetical protein
MFRLPLALALAAVATTAPAYAKPTAVKRPLTATYDTTSQRYCIRITSYDPTDTANAPIYRRTCMTEQQWRVRGVRFELKADGS